MRERVLTQRDLNRALLARQLLLGRRRVPVRDAIERLGALQAQWPPSPYLALWSRLEGFRREALARAIERRRVVKATLMRSTLHHVSARDYLAYAGLLRAARTPGLVRRAERNGIADDIASLSERVVQYAAAEPRSRPELIRLLDLPKLRTEDRRPWIVWHLLVLEAELVHSPESSAWRAHTAGAKFSPATVWLGASGADGDQAAAHLVRRYLGGFGPATRADAAQWTGLSAAALEPGFAQLELRRFRDERGRELFDLPRAPLPPADTEAPPRLLPRWDSALLAHDDRSRILPARQRSAVIRPNGDVQQVFLVDGFVAGIWQLDDGRVELEPFEPLPRAARRALEHEASALAAFAA